MKRVLVLLLCWAIPFSALAQESEELDAALAAIFPRYRTVGAVVAVAKDGELVYHYDYGWADRGQKRPVTAETYFKIASVTKMVSAMRVMQLVEAGSLDLDAPVGDYLGYEVVNPSYPDQPITLRQLMSHTSSIHGSYTSGQQLSKMLSPKNKRRWESWKPGSRYDYSNLGAGIMGSLMEAVTGQDVNTCVDEGVFQPLGIDAAFRVSLLDAPEQAALRYNTEGSLARGRNFYLNESYDPLAGPEAHYDLTIGDVWIRGDDLCRLGMLMLAGGTLGDVTLLQPETVAEMCASQQGRGGVTVDSPYGLCVQRVTTLLEDRMVYGHQGLSDGILCNVYWEPESGLVFVMITNGSSCAMDNHIGKLSRRVFAQVWDRFGD